MNPEIKSQERILPVDPYYTTRRMHYQVALKQQELRKKMDTYYPLEYQQAARGDWRENSPKDTLDNEWSLDTTQLNKLNEQLARSVVIEDLDIETHEVVPGAKVILVNPHDKSEISLTMVSFTDFKEGYLSINSEAGKTLLGKMRADQVRLQKNGIGYFVLDIQKPDQTFPVVAPESSTGTDEQQIAPVRAKTETQAMFDKTASRIVPTDRGITRQEPTAQGLQRPQEKLTGSSGLKKEKDTRQLIHRDEERFNNLNMKIPTMGGQITKQETSSKDLAQGKREVKSIIEFVVGGNRFKAELITRPKITSTQYRHTKRQGTSAEVTNIYGDEEIKTMYVYKLDRNNWVLVDFK